MTRQFYLGRWKAVRDDERSRLIVAFANMTWAREALPAKIEAALKVTFPKLNTCQ